MTHKGTAIDRWGSTHDRVAIRYGHSFVRQHAVPVLSHSI